MRIALLFIVLLLSSCNEDEYDPQPPAYSRDSSVAFLKFGFRNHTFDSAALLNAYEFMHRGGLQVFFWEDTAKAITRHLSIMNSKVITDEALIMLRNGEMVSTKDSTHYRIRVDGVDCWLLNPEFTDCNGQDHGNPVNLYYDATQTHVLVNPPSNH